jgi:hypothetical protein
MIARFSCSSASATASRWNSAWRTREEVAKPLKIGTLRVMP